MPFNGAGTFSPYTPGNPVIAGTTITAATHNATISDLASGLSNTITRDGQSPATANLPMGGFKLTGLGAATANGQSVRYEQVGALALGQGCAASGANTDITSIDGIAINNGAGVGTGNVVVGSTAAPTTGANNTAVGSVAGSGVTTGAYNAFFGAEAGLNVPSNCQGNVGVGYSALSTDSGSANTGVGLLTRSGATGSNNAAVGERAGSGSTGSYNNCMGSWAGYLHSGSYNMGLGTDSLSWGSGERNIALGYGALNTGNNWTGDTNIAIGTSALDSLTSGSANTEIGAATSTGTYAPPFTITNQSNRIVMGHTSVTNAYIQVAWTVVSDARDKTNFASIPHGLSFVNQLQPTAYQFKTSRGNEGIAFGPVRYGFKAQEVLALEGDVPVVVDTEDAEKLKITDSHLIPILVKAIQELSAKVTALEARL